MAKSEIALPPGFVLEDQQPELPPGFVLEGQQPTLQKTAPPSGFMRGLRDPIDAGAQLLTHVLPDSVVRAGNRFNNWMADKGIPFERIPEDDGLSSVITGQKPQKGFDKLISQKEAEYQAQRSGAGESGFDWGRLGGNILNPANIAVASKIPQAASLAGRIGLGVGSGAMFGMAQPVTEGDFATEKARQAGVGALFGGAMPMLTGGLARMIKPQPNKGVETLAKEGVETTLGQNLGGGFRKAEEALKSIPFAGDLIANAERRGIESFNKAALNRSLKPIGETLPKGLQAGNKSIAYASDKISAKYDDVLSKVHGTLDDQFLGDLDNLKSMAKSMPDAQRSQFERIIDNEVVSRFTQQGKASGETIKNIESKLGQMVKGYSRSDDYDKRLLGDAIKETQSSLREMLKRVNPTQADELQKVNSAFANLLRPQVAGSRVGAKEGVFTPGQLRSAVRELDPTKRKKGFGTGKALMQDLADAGDSVLANKLPDSGTAYRSIWNPSTMLGTAVGLPLSIPAAALYNPYSSKLLNIAMTQRPQLAAPLAKAVRNSSPFLMPGVVPFGYGLLNPSQQ